MGFKKILQERLPEKRFQHVLSVADFMKTFAPDLGLKKKAIKAAGLLHDYCRDMDEDQLLKKAKNFDIPVGDIEQQRPRLLHGPVAAEKVWRDLAVQDEQVYEAIYWHTTGRKGLCRLGQALYFADFSEPLRNYPEAGEARKVLKKKGFDEALLYVAHVKRFMLSKKSSVAPASEEFFLWLEKGKR